MAYLNARPGSVTKAVQLLYATFALGILRSALEYQALAESFSPGIIVTAWMLGAAIMLSLFYQIGRGRNWARITFLVLFGAGVPFAIAPLLHSISINPLSGIVGIVQTAGQITALVMLFQRSSNSWFRQPTPIKSDSVEF